VVRHIFQACPVWIYTQSNITSIIFTWVHYTNTEQSGQYANSWKLTATEIEWDFEFVRSHVDDVLGSVDELYLGIELVKWKGGGGFMVFEGRYVEAGGCKVITIGNELVVCLWYSEHLSVIWLISIASKSNTCVVVLENY
jgi:hypothetical protein